MRNRWNDNSGSWMTVIIDVSWQWCVPLNMQIRDDECASIPCKDGSSGSAAANDSSVTANDSSVTGSVVVRSGL